MFHKSDRLLASHGYVLLFTLGTLVVISVLVLGMSVSLRLDASLTLSERQRLQDVYALRAALEQTAAQLTLAQVAERAAAARPLSDQDKAQFWQVGGGPYTLRLEGREFSISLEDGGWLPDANLLTREEWQRLLVQVGAEPRVEAAALAEQILQARQELTKNVGGIGFGTLQELLDLPTLPQRIAYGSAASQTPGLKNFLLVGSNLKQLEINRSPLLLFRVLGQVPEDVLDQLAKQRAEGSLTLPEATRLLAGTKVRLYVGKTGSVMARATLLHGNGRAGQRISALLSAQEGFYRPAAVMLDLDLASATQPTEKI